MQSEGKAQEYVKEEEKVGSREVATRERGG